MGALAPCTRVPLSVPATSPGTGGEGGCEGKKNFVYLQWASHFWLSIQKFTFPQRNVFLVLGVWVVWPWGGGPPDHPPPPPRISTSLVLAATSRRGLPAVLLYWSGGGGGGFLVGLQVGRAPPTCRPLFHFSRGQAPLLCRGHSPSSSAMFGACRCQVLRFGGGGGEAARRGVPRAH